MSTRLASDTKCCALSATAPGTSMGKASEEVRGPPQGCDDQLQQVHVAFERMANIKEYRQGFLRSTAAPNAVHPSRVCCWCTECHCTGQDRYTGYCQQ